MSLSENIKKFRLEKNLTQEQLAAKLCISAQAVSNGKQAIRTQTARSCCRLQESSAYPLTNCSATNRHPCRTFPVRSLR